ncbi:YaiI/YqxD family protein [Acuticoccus sediminis]|uniref:YaiI/YqxD family protein n=1 Tax=Acuticoccus sediminis TaxID=2184697 RepID=UPI001CFE355C|nr:YaiI/YqxD family protein [Acuticoccus sediminis]
MRTIFVDADACPVKDETIRVADRYQFQVVMVSNGGIRPRREPFVETVVVPAGPDEADKWIADRAGPGDICVTSDIPLAARVLEGGATAVRPNGEAFTSASIGNELATRDLMADWRAANPLSAGGGGKTFTPRDRSRFLQTLDRLVRAAVRVGEGPAGA